MMTVLEAMRFFFFSFILHALFMFIYIFSYFLQKVLDPTKQNR